jgi:hypothetical protein
MGIVSLNSAGVVWRTVKIGKMIRCHQCCIAANSLMPWGVIDIVS